MHTPARRLLWLLALALVAVAVVLFALTAGAYALPWRAALRLAFVPDESAAAQVVSTLRAPRVLAAFACGGLLALSGALMQVLLRNPLADPYVLGLSGGAAVGALLAMLAGAASVLVHASAFGGALAVMLLVLGLSHGEGGWTPTRMLLTGVVVGSGCAAVIALVLSIAPAAQLPGMVFWLMGDASAARTSAPAWGALALAAAVVWPLARELNVLAAGALTAQALGVAVARVRVAVYLIASLMTAVAVSSVGAVGFVGLIVPHALRRLVGPDHRVLLPAGVLGGGSLLVLADTLARTVAAPLYVPVGVLMALIGVPAFLLLLAREARS